MNLSPAGSPSYPGDFFPQLLLLLSLLFFAPQSLAIDQDYFLFIPAVPPAHSFPNAIFTWKTKAKPIVPAAILKHSLCLSHLAQKKIIIQEIEHGEKRTGVG